MQPTFCMECSLIGIAHSHRLDEPIQLRGGQSIGMYVHSALPDSDMVRVISHALLTSLKYIKISVCTFMLIF